MYVGPDPALFDNEGSTATIFCDSGDAVTYSRSRSSAAIGTLTAGQSASITYPVWVTSAGSSQVHVEVPSSVFSTSGDNTLTGTNIFQRGATFGSTTADARIPVKSSIGINPGRHVGPRRAPVPEHRRWPLG
jgi:hypothetical protein